MFGDSISAGKHGGSRSGCRQVFPQQELEDERMQPFAETWRRICSRGIFCQRASAQRCRTLLSGPTRAEVPAEVCPEDRLQRANNQPARLVASSSGRCWLRQRCLDKILSKGSPYLGKGRLLRDRTESRRRAVDTVQLRRLFSCEGDPEHLTSVRFETHRSDRRGSSGWAHRWG